LKSPTVEELADLHQLTEMKIGKVASFEDVRAVYQHNPDSFWSIYSSPSDNRKDAKCLGYYGLLMLNEAGLDALQRGTLNGRNPDLSLLAPAKTRPAAVYVWALVASSFAQQAGMLLGWALGDDLYRGVPYCAMLGTTAGARRFAKLRGKNVEDFPLGSVGVIPEEELGREFKLAMDVRPGRRIRRPETKAIICSNGEEVSRAMAVRAAVFMIEQNCPYPEEFDGNDYCSAHVLGTIDGEPAAAMRIRYFADFAKLERLAVLPRFRRTLIARDLVECAVEVCRRKGYRKVYGHAQKHLVHFWGHFGFQPLQKNRHVVFSDHEYIEMWGALAPHPDAITMDSDPMTIIRPEGKWDAPGILDESSKRAPTNPH
jgi:predicted GNAT family N-acyltransferase